jgi:hypothetical protein
MGGRGQWAERRRTDSGFTRTSTGRNLGEVRSTAAAAGGGGEVTTTSDGTKISGASDAQIKATLGAKFSREEVAKITGAAAGSTVAITMTSSGVRVYTNNNRAGYHSTFRLEKDASGVTFYGDSLFANNSATIASGSAIRGIRTGMVHAVNNKMVYRVVVPNAIGSGNSSASQGSNLWARMGVSTKLSNISNLAARPASLRRATEVAHLMSTKEGRAWWSANRQGFRGELNFTKKSSAGYKLAKKFFGKGLK